MKIRAVVTVAPNRRSLSARSMATGGGIKRTDCPIHKTPGRLMNGGGASGPASDRPKNQLGHTNRERSGPPVHVIRQQDCRLRRGIRVSMLFRHAFLYVKLYYSLSLGACESTPGPLDRASIRLARTPLGC